MNEMSVDEAMAKALEYDEKHKDIPSVSRTLAAEILRLRAQWQSGSVKPSTPGVYLIAGRYGKTAARFDGLGQWVALTSDTFGPHRLVPEAVEYWLQAPEVP